MCHGDGYSAFNRLVTVKIIYLGCIALHRKSTKIKLNKKTYIHIYHIFCCNMLIFACPTIAKGQCWLFALIYPYLPTYSPSGNCAVVSQIICQSTRKDDA